MGNELLPGPRRQASRLGWMAVGGWLGTAFFTWQFGGILAFLAFGGAVLLTIRWFTFRAKWGLRF